MTTPMPPVNGNEPPEYEQWGSVATEDDRLRERVHELRDVVDAASVVPRQAVRESRDAVDVRIKKYWWPRIVGASALAAVLAGVGTGYVFNDVLGDVVQEQQARDAAQDAAADGLRQRTAQYAAAGQSANDVLRGRGQPVVDIPAPGAVPDSQIIVRSIAAQVLSMLPPTASSGPTAEQVGQQIAAFLAANPQNVVGANADPAQIATAVATYFETNADDFRGEQGEQGEQGERGLQGPGGDVGPVGPPPTADQIMAAFTDTVRANPNLLCPAGGSYSRSEVVGNGGQLIILFGCAEPGGTPGPGPDPGPDPTTDPPSPTQEPDPTTDPSPSSTDTAPTSDVLPTVTD